MVDKLNEAYIYTVEILLEYSEDDLIEMGLSKGLARTMLRKAKEIAKMQPEPQLNQPPSGPQEPQPAKEASPILISMDMFKDIDNQ